MSEAYRTHVCLVSNEAAANLLPVLDAAFRPQEVVLVETPQMREQGRWLAEALKSGGIAHVRHVPVSDAYDVARIESDMNAFLLAERSREGMALNVTGGTKPLAIAAQEVFRIHNVPVFYVRHDTSELFFVGRAQPPRRLKARLRLEQYLAAHGRLITTCNRAAAAEPDLALARELVKEIGSLGKAIPMLNRVCGELAERRLLRFEAPRNAEGDPNFERLVALIAESGKCRREGAALVFVDEVARSFAAGGWLETYVFDAVRTLQGRGLVDDAAQNCEIVQPGGSKNELDVALLARNRLFIIECKTRRLSGRGTEDAARDALYKLDSLTQIGGLNTRGLFASYRDLDPADRQRAKDLRIATVVGPALQRLRQEIESWLSRPY